VGQFPRDSTNSAAGRQSTKYLCRESFGDRYLSHLIVTMRAMDSALIDQAIELLEKANADLQSELLPASVARRLLATYARARRLVDFGIAGLSRKLDDVAEVARVTGTSIGRAKAVVQTGKTMSQSGDLSAALQHGDISLDQAAEIAAAEASAPGAATTRAGVQRQSQAALLKVPSGKDGARSQGREAQTSRTVT
jgi:hypothetical protein